MGGGGGTRVGVLVGVEVAVAVRLAVGEEVNVGIVCVAVGITGVFVNGTDSPSKVEVGESSLDPS